MSEKLQTLAAQLKEAVEKTPDKEQIFAAERWLAQVGYSDSRVHSSGAIARLLAGYASEYVRNLVPPLLEEIGKPSSASTPSGEIDPQCYSIDNSYRCELYRGHDGKHLNREIEITEW